MLKSPKLTVAVLILTASAGFAQSGEDNEPLGLGREALPEEVAAWNVDVSPDGTGLPEGSGDALTGEDIYSEKCASCHGEFAEGVDNWPKLAGGDGTLDDKDPLKTVGSYWPYVSTLWDYVHRSMPFGDAQTLSADETYAITAYILYSNYVIEDDFVLSKESFSEVVLPNAEGFVVDDRAATEYSQWSGEPCMENCKENVEIIMHATVLDVTPDEAASEGEEASADEVPADEVPDDEVTADEVPDEEATTEDAPAEAAPAEDTAEAAGAIDAELAAKGEKVFNKCKACHKVGEGAKNGTGPELNGILGSVIGSAEGFKYSNVMTEAGAGGAVWERENLHEFLTNPKQYLNGTKMSFGGLKKPEEIDAVIEFLKQFPAE